MILPALVADDMSFNLRESTFENRSGLGTDCVSGRTCSVQCNRIKQAEEHHAHGCPPATMKASVSTDIHLGESSQPRLKHLREGMHSILYCLTNRVLPCRPAHASGR